jgi:hypothetical protein
MTTMPRKLAGALAASALSVASVLILAASATGPAGGQPSTPPTANPWNDANKDKGQVPDEPPRRHRANKAKWVAAPAGLPTMPGQDAFGAIAEIVRTLEADPDTDWSKVDLEALRQHLIDMNEVTLNAVAAGKPIEGGLEITVTGTGRTIAAIQRMVPAHAKEIDGLNGWSAKAQTLAKGARLTVTSTDADEVQHIRGLGFIGLMVTGSHHQEHHLAMAKGAAPHRH